MTTLGPLLSDLDGTIADTAPAIFAGLRETCDALGIPLAADADLSFCLGPPLHWCLEQIGVTQAQLPEAIEMFERAHDAHMDLVVPMPGADVTIASLAQAGVPIGVATIKPQAIAERVLERVGVAAFVSCVHGRSDDMDPRTKTDLLREARAELAGDTPLYVGDHANDERAAAELAIPFLWYPDHPWDEIGAAVLGGAVARR